VAATGSIVEGPLAAVAMLNATALPSAQAGYELMIRILGDNEAPLIFASLGLSGEAIVAGLAAYEASLAAGRLSTREA
jgi:hypothetical protein